MSIRMNYHKVHPEMFKAMLNLEKTARESGLEPELYELVKIRASQLNRCAYCIDMHIRDACKRGETEERIYMLSAWQEARCYSPRERAALAYTEAATMLTENGVPDALYEEVRTCFDEREYAALVLAVATINAWNRIGVSMGLFPRCYEQE